MNLVAAQAAQVAQTGSLSPKGNGTDRMHMTQLSIEPAGKDAAEFRAALERHMQQEVKEKAAPVSKNSLGEKIMTRTTNMAEQIKHDQQYVSTMLEQASRNGDSMQMMKAMMALNDYQMRVQYISKTVSKASSSVDQLTKLQ